MEDRTSFFCPTASLRSASLDEQLTRVTDRRLDECEKGDVEVRQHLHRRIDKFVEDVRLFDREETTDS